MMIRKMMAVSCLVLGAQSVFAAVNVNSASLEELQSVSGLDAQKAQAIVDFRNQNGAFQSVQDLKKVPGLEALGEDVLQKEFSVDNAAPAAVEQAAPVQQ